MVNIRPKTMVEMKMSSVGETHARSRISTRDVEGMIDEPLVRDGTNQGFSPTETLMASLMGCTNVIGKRIAHKMGLEMGDMNIALTAQFDRRGTILAEEVEVPFSNIVMDISVATDASPQQIESLQADLAKYCPIAKVIRGSGATITENWTTTPL